MLIQSYAEWFRYSVLVIAASDLIKKSSILILPSSSSPYSKEVSFLQTAG